MERLKQRLQLLESVTITKKISLWIKLYSIIKKRKKKKEEKSFAAIRTFPVLTNQQRQERN